MPAFLPVDLLHLCLHAFLLVCTPVCLPVDLHLRLPACPPVSLHLSAYPLTSLLLRLSAFTFDVHLRLPVSLPSR